MEGMEGIQPRLLGVLWAAEEGLCQAKGVGERGRSGFPLGPKQTHWDIHDGGTFRPGDWEALLAKKKEKEGNPRPSFPFPRREWVQGLRSLPCAGLWCPLSSEAERGRHGLQGWCLSRHCPKLCPPFSGPEAIPWGLPAFSFFK